LNFKILSDEKDVYKSKDGSGIHPREAARHHTEKAAYVVHSALEHAGTTPKELDCIAYSAGPGLGPCLRIGAVVARALASYYRKPLIPTNHAVGHIELGKCLTSLGDPFVLLISGGHTALVGRRPEGWRIFGETLDLTLGQLLDQLGRFFGLSSPAGPQIEKLASECARQQRENPGCAKILNMPYTVKGNDVSYSGLLSACKDLYSEGTASKELVSYSLQEYAFSMLVEATERALAFTDSRELLVTGGVAANKRLADMLGSMCEMRRTKLGIIPPGYAGDCGSQIAVAGSYIFGSGVSVAPEKAFIRQSWRLDTVSA
jgi:N6-L-threonylcarbamoyladenine synthase